MSIDPNKAFGMKATDKSYTLEFRRGENMTELSATDLETPKMTFGQRLAAAWSILTGSKSIGEYVFPIRLRNADFYHLSFIYRPEKEKIVEKIIEKIVEVPAKPKQVKADKPVTMKAAKPKAEKSITSDKPTAEKPVRKSRTPRKPKTENTAL